MSIYEIVCTCRVISTQYFRPPFSLLINVIQTASAGAYSNSYSPVSATTRSTAASSWSIRVVPSCCLPSQSSELMRCPVALTIETSVHSACSCAGISVAVSVSTFVAVDGFSEDVSLGGSLGSRNASVTIISIQLSPRADICWPVVLVGSGTECAS